jgi:Adenylate cyclase regulatory domain
MGVDFASEGLLDGPDGEPRAARLELLERLHAEGASLDELRDAVGAPRRCARSASSSRSSRA